jgi:hypothetical protein
MSDKVFLFLFDIFFISLFGYGFDYWYFLFGLKIHAWLQLNDSSCDAFS